jgi:hypothetical protein
MGIFGRKKDKTPSNPSVAPTTLYAWELPDDGRAHDVANVQPDVVEAILVASGSPNKNQTVRASLRLAGVSSIEVYWEGHLAGSIEGPETVSLMDGLRFLAASGRYAVVKMNVPSRKSKFSGSLSVVIPWNDVAVPFNQPPAEFPDLTYGVSPSIKNTHLHVGDLRRLAPTHGTPGWFVLTPTADGGVDVYAPEYGRPGLGTKVGAVYKEDVQDTMEKLSGHPCAVLGRVLWQSNGPQIRLRW